MSSNEDTRDEELLARYRRASADGTGRPSDAARASILAESRRVADELAKRAPLPGFDTSRPAANDSRWKVTAFGTIGAALLAALIFAPRYWEHSAPRNAQSGPAPVTARETAPASPPAPVQEGTQASNRSSASEAVPAPKLEEIKPSAASSTAPRVAQSPSNSTSLQDIVVTGARKKTANSYAAQSPIAATPAPAAPPSVAANYAPVPPRATNMMVAPAAGSRPLDLSARQAQRAAKTNEIESADRAAGASAALKPSTLESAVAQGDLAQATSLLDQGAPIDARDEAGRTPLMLAVSQDRLEIVRLLLARGADPNAADNDGHTPLQQATKRNLQDVAALLEQAGAH
jgi:hypothetical protein